MPEDLDKSLLETIQIQNETISELRLVVEQSRREVARLATRLAAMTAAGDGGPGDNGDHGNASAPTSLGADIRPIEEEIMSLLRAAARPLKATVIAAKLKRRPTSYFWEALRTLSATGLIEKTTDKQYHLPTRLCGKRSSTLPKSGIADVSPADNKPHDGTTGVDRNSPRS